MPNHVQNILIIEGHESHLKPMLEKIKGDKCAIDFHEIIPFPKELEGTCSPAKIVSQTEYNKIQRLKDFQAEDPFKGMVGEAITKKMSKDFIERFGYDNWYDWKIAKWGTKWGAYEATIDDPIPLDKKNYQRVVIHFQTAWSSGAQVIANLADQFPTLTYELTYADEDCGYNVGQYWFKNGCVEKENIPEGGTNDAMELYFHCWCPDKEGWEMKNGEWEYTAEW